MLVKENLHGPFSTSFPQFYFEFSTEFSTFPHFIHRVFHILSTICGKFHFQFSLWPRGTIEIFIFKIHSRNVRNFHFQTVRNFIFNFNFRLWRASVIISHLPHVVNFIPLSWKIAQENNR